MAVCEGLGKQVMVKQHESNTGEVRTHRSAETRQQPGSEGV